MDVLWALLLIGVALFLGGILLRSLPGSWLAFGAVLVVFGLGIPALVIDDNKSETQSGSGSEAAAAPEAATGGTETTESGGGGEKGGSKKGGGGGGNAQAVAQGKQLFQQNCGTCHTLGDAGTNGKVGPDLDQVKPDDARVEAAIEKGGLGSGTMPANIVTGADAKAVATYVSTVAGK